jgi:septum formation protein
VNETLSIAGESPAAPLILASASPRRRELLEQIGVPHEVLAVDVDESPLPGESPEQLVCRLARDKAVAGRALSAATRPVLGADTLVVLGGQVFGKPRDAADAMRTLQALSGQVHTVMTAVALAMPDGALLETLSQTEVRMRPLSPAEILGYWSSGEPAGKAGAYAIQGRGAAFIEHIRGSYSGVMGLPLYETARLLQAQGLYGAHIPP